MKSLLVSPATTWNRTEHEDMKVKDWIEPSYGECSDDYDVVITGVPLSRSSISASAASEYPDYFRKSWNYFTTYSIDENVDFRALRVADLGDVKLHGTNILQCHENIEQAMTDVMEGCPNSFYVQIGGDHSITAPIVRAFAKHSGKRIGILQFDTHLDLRATDSDGPTNGTPIRQLLDAGVVRGEDVYNIGLHGFYNASSLIRAADHYGVNRITLKDFRRHGAATVITDVMQQLAEKVDLVYVTVDMDVLDIAYAPGVPASTPGGMRTDELFDLLHEVGKYEIVRGMDFVCLDPHRDTSELQTVKAGAYAFLTMMVSRFVHLK
ncbi:MULTISPECIES: agmatinase family protein [Solibacillus]|uniref:Agmatinase family protein n=1 Tax=Solibacillus merdavium TaxID=2762218 RepID=A0ABR8XRK7_9BACL|nr:agmatinase family protein [Solibacillus merdavium]MBD8034575.1 agmatinase family protein [Solibacillus merdavium]